MKRLLLWLVGVAVVLVGAAVAASALPGSFAWSWLIVINRGATTSVVSLYTTCHSPSPSAAPVRMTVGIDQRYMRIHPGDLACFELPTLRGEESTFLGPLSETLLAERFDPPLRLPSESPTLRELKDFLAAIARSGVDAVASSNLPTIDSRDSESSPAHWYLSSKEPGLSVSPRWPLVAWFAVLAIAGLGLLTLADRRLFASGAAQPANNPA